MNCAAVEPGKPVLSVDAAEQDMHEAQTVQFTCTSSGGNPAPNVTWYRNGSPVTGVGSSVMPPAVKFGATVGTLTWNLSSADHLANFSCSVSTQLMPGSQIFSELKNYSVECK